MLAAGLIVSRFVHLVSVLALFGASLFPIYAFTGGRDEDARRRVIGWLRGPTGLCAVLALASGLGWFAFTAGGMSGSLAGAIDPQVLLAVLSATDFGPLWVGRLALICVLLLAAAAGRKVDWIAPALSALILASLAGTGHARGAEGWPGALHIAADAVHLLAAGVWLGGLWPLGAALAWAHRGEIARMEASADLLMRFSGVGYLAVAALVASGVANSWFILGSIRALTTGLYGPLLLVKVALFGSMAALAAVNRFWITPQLHRSGADRIGPWLHRIRRHVAAELALGLLVVAVVSLLGTLQPSAA